ncbi:MAG TPA: hypothetical protein VN736_08310 [Candidatus Limnocylindrales bacterium]|nr:hypothetical protein [Candidatus Limnocylindrales bacterium]
MVRYVKIFVAVCCIVCILALCIAPYADIPVTVLDTLQFVIMLIFALVGAVLLLTGAFPQLVISRVVLRAEQKSPTRSLLPPIETTCVQQV